MKKSLDLYRTSKSTSDRLTQQESVPFQPDSAWPGMYPDPPTVIVDDRTHYQTLLGFGAAFTEAAADTFYKLSHAKQAEVLRAYFSSESGHGYSLCRTHINSSDFSLGNYAYTEVDGDVNLEHFSIERDRQAVIPMVKAAQDVSSRPLTLFASPWSPPAWMKTNDQMNQGGKLRPEYRAAWARYYGRYIREYAEEGIAIWGVSVQNEPAAVQTWDSCIYTAEEERDFVRDYLGPALAEMGLGGTKIIVWDHNRDQIFERAQVILGDPEAAKYVWGVGFHWYGGEYFDHVQAVHDAFPETNLVFTEGCQEGGPHLGSWDLGERYARSMINDLNRWTVGWVDWNIILNQQGGPNHVGNYCSAPIVADTDTDTLHYQSSYYYIGHFSRFIRPGAKRIVCTVSQGWIEATAFQNPDGSIVVVVMNRTGDAHPFYLRYRGEFAQLDVPARSIHTAVFAR